MKKFLLKFISIFSVVFLFPVVSFAQEITGSACGLYQNTLWKIACQIKELFGLVLPILVSLGVIYFIWGVVQYVINDEEEAKTKGRDRIIYGLIGLAVIIGMWGLVNILLQTFGLQNSTAPSLVQLTGASYNCPNPGPKVQDLLCYVTRIINDSVIPLLFALAVVMFAWGTINFLIINADEEAKREEGKQFMIWGIIALAGMISVWGLVKILAVTFGITDTSFLPQVAPHP